MKERVNLIWKDILRAISFGTDSGINFNIDIGIISGTFLVNKGGTKSGIRIKAIDKCEILSDGIKGGITRQNEHWNIKWNRMQSLYWNKSWNKRIHLY